MSGTSTSSFTASAIVPNHETWGHYQRFTFPDTDSLVKLQTFSEFVPTSFNNSVIGIESRNFNYAGFRWHHLTKSTDVNFFGSFTFQSFIADGAGIDIYGFDGTDFNIYFPVNMNSSKIINLGTPTVGTDAANKTYVDSLFSVGTVVLTGDVTGSGVIGTPFPTTLSETISRAVGEEFQAFEFVTPIAKLQVSGLFVPFSSVITPGIIELSNYLSSGFRLVQLSAATDTNYFGQVTFESFVGTALGTPIWSYVSSTNTFNFHLYLDMETNSIVNLGTPLTSGDAANKGYVDNAISSATIVLSGNVTGTATIGTMPIVTTLNMTLNTIPLAVANVNLNTHKIINVVNPTSAQDAATKNYVDTSIAAGTIVLTGNVTGSGVVGTSFATTLALSLDQITVAAANVNLNSHKIINLSTPTTGTDAANKSYVDSAIVAGTIVLTGNVTGSGVVGTSFATTLALRLDQITLAGANVNINTHKLINVVDPTSAQDAVTKAFFEAAVFPTTVFCNGSAPALKFPNSTLNRKISLFESSANDHQYFGFGVNTSILRYQVGDTSSDHVFYAGTSSSTSNEVGRITGTGNIIMPGISYSRNIHGNIIMIANSTGFTANNTWVKAAGTTTLQSGREFTMPSNNRLTYTGTTQATITAIVSATVSWGYASVVNDVIYIGIYKNGTTPIYYQPLTNAIGGYQISSVSVEVDFSTNDYVEVWGFVAGVGTSTLTLWGMSLTAIRV